jgi:hypothetical protein
MRHPVNSQISFRPGPLRAPLASRSVACTYDIADRPSLAKRPSRSYPLEPVKIGALESPTVARPLFCRLHRCSPNRPSAVHLPRRPPNIGDLRRSAGLPALRPVEIHLESKTVAARWMMALLLALISVLVTESGRREPCGVPPIPPCVRFRTRRFMQRGLGLGVPSGARSVRVGRRRLDGWHSSCGVPRSSTKGRSRFRSRHAHAVPSGRVASSA